MQTEVQQECGMPRCSNYGKPDGPENPCPDDHIVDRHPGVDPDWRPATYRYHDSKLAIIHVSQVPIDDESALMYFHQVAKWFGEVSYVAKAEPGEHNEYKMMPYRFEEGQVISLA
jgi:hypothetical protein